MRGVAGWGRRIGLQAVGWLLLVVGVAALVLPGPGLLMMFAGMAILAQENEWAERKLEPVKRRAFEAAAEGVKTWPRIVASSISATAVMAVGALWIVQPPAPGWWPLRESWWLVGGWGAGVSMIVSGIVAFVLIVYSYKRFRGVAVDDLVDERAVAREAASPDRP
ncbi:PGPGW domain-containing protein [Solicola sp. PLA-1-18]|uniref:PGPGW domain-containing protein n=1 Tax=Solicola sp. PLA-1-18 TaxID=3380532 RepID=UPI003B7DA583